MRVAPQGLLGGSPAATLVLVGAALLSAIRGRARRAAGALTALGASYALFAGVFVYLANIDAGAGGMGAGVLERFWMQVRAFDVMQWLCCVAIMCPPYAAGCCCLSLSWDRYCCRNRWQRRGKCL